MYKIKMNKIKEKWALIIGICCLLYFFAITVFIGYLNTYNCIWIFIGALFIVYHKQKRNIKNIYKRIPKIIRLFSLAFVFLCILSFVILEVLIIHDSRNKNIEHAYCIVLLGAGLNGSKPSLTLLQRMNAAEKYLKENKLTKVVVSGGQGNDETSTEAEIMSTLLQYTGIEPDRIIIEDKSTNTYENLSYSAKLIDIDKKILIASSGFHLFRAKNIARKLGYKNIGGIASGTPLLLLPNYYVREYFAVIKEKLVGNI